MAAPTKVIGGFRRVQIAWGQTLQQIAAFELGDASRWSEIAALNKLKPPWITGDPTLAGQSVALYGATIMVPAVVADIEVGYVDAEQIFKNDVLLDHGDLTAENGDFARVLGRNNLRQALEHRIRVNLGELLFHPNYGCAIARLKGAGNTLIDALLGAKYVEFACNHDKRIAQVLQVVVTPTGDQLPVEAELETVSGHPVNLTVTV